MTKSDDSVAVIALGVVKNRMQRNKIETNEPAQNRNNRRAFARPIFRQNALRNNTLPLFDSEVFAVDKRGDRPPRRTAHKVDIRGADGQVESPQLGLEQLAVDFDKTFHLGENSAI